MGCVESHFVSLVKLKDDFTVVCKYCIELYKDSHFVPTPFAAFLAVACFDVHKYSDICWQKSDTDLILSSFEVKVLPSKKFVEEWKK